MAINSPTVSYGKSVLFTSYGSTVDNGDDTQSYGKSVIFHEYVAPTAGAIMNQLQNNNLGADLFNGSLI